MSEKINGDMSIQEMVLVMSEGNPGAIAVIVDMLTKSSGFFDILMLDSLDIRGSKLYMLHNDCCSRDSAKFERTLMAIRHSVFTTEQVHNNLERCYAIPFIDDSIKIDGVPPYGENFGPDHPMWDTWCKEQKKSFERRS